MQDEKLRLVSEGLDGGTPMEVLCERFGISRRDRQRVRRAPPFNEKEIGSPRMRMRAAGEMKARELERGR